VSTSPSYQQSNKKLFLVRPNTLSTIHLFSFLLFFSFFFLITLTFLRNSVKMGRVNGYSVHIGAALLSARHALQHHIQCLSNNEERMWLK
jgi:hypothetical protein